MTFVNFGCKQLIHSLSSPYNEVNVRQNNVRVYRTCRKKITYTRAITYGRSLPCCRYSHISKKLVRNRRDGSGSSLQSLGA